jgi:lipopolysaccharide export system ATP-binding protein
MDMARLVAQNLGKRYRSRWVVKDVSIDVNAGEIVGLLGPNGAGKTTAFYMIVGLVSANRGSVRLDHQDITRSPIHVRALQGIGYLPQEPSVFRKLSVENNILAVLELQPKWDLSERNRRLELLLEEFHLSHVRDSLGISLSGGERRRTEIARALAMDPQFILLDEPFAGVDPISVMDIKKIILELSSRGIGILITDHNVRETLDICDKAYIVNEGSVLACGTPQMILADQNVRKVYLGDRFTL